MELGLTALLAALLAIAAGCAQDDPSSASPPATAAPAAAGEGAGEGEGEEATDLPPRAAVGEGEGEGEGAAQAPQAPGPDLDCAEDGCLLEATRGDELDAAGLQPFLQPGVQIRNGYSIWAVRYRTDGRDSLATVTVPFPVDPPPGGYGVVANNHGTTGVDDLCALTGTVYGVGLAGLFGAQGAIGVATDYPGIGTSGVHPYLVSEVEGRASLDAIRAAMNLARWLDVEVSDRAAAVGLSQGGHATLAAAAEHAAGWASEVDMRAFGLTAPASVFLEHWQAGLAFSGPHMPFHAMLIHAWAEHYGHAGPALWSAPLMDGQGDDDVADVLATACLGYPPGAGIGDRLPDAPDLLFSPGFLAAYQAGAWGEKYALFGNGFAANRVVPFAQSAPIGIWQGDADGTVPKQATDGLVAALRAGGMEIEYTIVPGGGHTDTAFGFVASAERATDESIAWIVGHLYAEEAGP